MRCLILCLATWWLLLALVIAGDRQRSSCESQLSLHLSPEQTRVVKGGVLQVAVELRNSGSEPRWLYGDLTRGVWLHIYDASGVEVQPRAVYDHTPPESLSTREFVRLLPDHSLVLHDRYPESDLGLAPGRYVAKVDFMFMPVPEEIVFSSACSGWLHGVSEVRFEVIK